MITITVDELKQEDACPEGIVDFIAQYGERGEVAVDELVITAININSPHVGWLFTHVGELLSDGFDWSKLDIYRLFELLTCCPKFIDDRCDFSKLDGQQTLLMLLNFPHLADRCDFSKLDGWETVLLLRRHKKFADRCDMSVLSRDDWTVLLNDQHGRI